MYTERGHPLVPSRALTPGPIPTPPTKEDEASSQRRTKKRGRGGRKKFGPIIFQKPKPVIFGMSVSGIATTEST